MGQTAKALGAYYTPRPLAEELVRGAVRKPTDRVFDPSCGDGVFLGCAIDRLRRLGRKARHLPDQIEGVDVNPSALARAEGMLRSRHPSLRWGRLHEENFFTFARKHLGTLTFDAVVGNPPYIRYQNFADRDRAVALAAKVGVTLSRESSSWASFVAIASAFVAPGGRLAMVVPREAHFVNYARPLFEFLHRRFGRVELTPVEGMHFEALERVSLLIAEDMPGVSSRFPVSSFQMEKGFVPLAQVATVRLGIVTGAKEFFVLRRGDARVLSLRRHLVPVVSTPGQLRQGVVTPSRTDWLLRVRTAPDRTLRAYIKEGEQRGFHERYKCRIRDPWFAVPEQQSPDAFLSYLFGDVPHMALNRAGARATNNVHAVWWKDHPAERTRDFNNPVTLRSILALGRQYAGGVRKIEPGDAARILVTERI